MTSSLIPNLKIKGGKTIFCLLLGTLLLTGCEGPSTTVLPSAESREEEGSIQLSFRIPESSTDRLMKTVETLYAGNTENQVMDEVTETEYDVASDPSVYIVSALRNHSYDVSQTGEIIEAVLRSQYDDADICLAIACYGDPSVGAPASDTAAGAAVLLETAEILSEFSGDTEIHFVFLPGERSDTEYVYTYLSEIYAPDAERCLGAVVMGGLGLNGAAENELGCIEAKATFMAEEINRICVADLGSECDCTYCSEGIQNALLRNLIPSVVYRQREAAEAGTVLDCPSLIDYDDLKESVDVLSRTLALLLGDTTPSMIARAHYTDDADVTGKEIFAWGEEDIIPFDESERSLETLTGLVGEKISENIINNGNDLSGYRFPMKWFGSDKACSSDFYYLSDTLQSVQIRAFEEEIGYDEICEVIGACYGEGTETSQGPYGPVCEWMIPMQRLRITLQPQKEGYDLSLTEYDTPISVYPPQTLGAVRLENLFKEVIPEGDFEYIGFEAYTDGYGATLGKLAYSSAGTQNRRATLGIDLDDSINKDASFKDKERTVGEIVRLYGIYLADEDRDLCYSGYRDRFGGDADEFASSLRLFSLSDTPRDEAGPAADTIRYFYDFVDLKDFRDRVRGIR